MIGNADADDWFVGEADDGAGLGLAPTVDALPGVGLALASGAGIPVGAVEQVVTKAVTGIGFGVGVMLPIGAAAAPVDSAGVIDGAAEVGAWLGFVAGAWLGLTGVVRLGGVMLL